MLNQLKQIQKILKSVKRKLSENDSSLTFFNTWKKEEIEEFCDLSKDDHDFCKASNEVVESAIKLLDNLLADKKFNHMNITSDYLAKIYNILETVNKCDELVNSKNINLKIDEFERVSLSSNIIAVEQNIRTSSRTANIKLR